MNESQAQLLLDFMDRNWSEFESICMEKEEDPEWIRSEVEKIALGD